MRATTMMQGMATETMHTLTALKGRSIRKREDEMKRRAKGGRRIRRRRKDEIKRTAMRG
jgi:hypothetical protein